MPSLEITVAYADGLRKLSQWNLLELDEAITNGQYVSMLSTVPKAKVFDSWLL